MRPTIPIPPLGETAIASFQAKVSRQEGCWPWIGSIGASGYGVFSVRGKLYGAHRVSFAIHNGQDPAELHVCHSCDNPVCVNPAHLWLGTQSDNMRDATDKGRRGYVRRDGYCRHGHEYNAKNTHMTAKGRTCRGCNRLARERYRARKAAALTPTPA